MQLEKSETPLEDYPTQHADDNTFLPQIGVLLEITTSINGTDIAGPTDAGNIYDIKGIRVTTTRNEQIYIKGNRKVLK